MSYFRLLLLILLCWLLSVPAWSIPESTDRTPLTLELLRERVNQPTLHEGSVTVDLREMVIDLRPENASFRDEFYQTLRKELQKTGSVPLGLDLSNSLIQGDFIGSDLGLRTPLYAQAIAPLFTTSEQEQLERLRGVCLQSLALSSTSSKDCKSLLATEQSASSDISVFRGSLTLEGTHFNGCVSFSNTFFLQPVNVHNAMFTQEANWTETRFSRAVRFSGAKFQRKSQFQDSVFFDKADFKQTQFQASTNFQNSTFEGTANFIQASFHDLAQFNRIQWRGNVNFSLANFLAPVQFIQDHFNQLLSFPEARFEEAVTFRATQFDKPVSLQGANIVNQADFSDTEFSKEAFLNVSSLGFQSNQAKILGNSGQIGKVIFVSTLQGNQSVLRNLGQNFRQLQQIADANQIDYKKQRLQLTEIRHHLLGTNINNASVEQLIKLGFSHTQAQAIAQRRVEQIFRNPRELLTLADIDQDTYTQVSEKVVVGEPLSAVGWILEAWHWLVLDVLLLLSGYGTDFWLVFGIGMIAIAYFGLMFWLVDRFRRLRPVPIIPTRAETTSTLIGFSFFTVCGLLSIFQNAEQPWLTLGCLSVLIFPIPAILVLRLYQQGRYHDLMYTSYFTEDGTLRQLRLLIGRLPIIPRYQLFRERYLALLWNRRWNWLNYYDFSLNNLLKIGFNDVRLRDEHLPHTITTLAWYQWSLGILYITLLLWTLSRTIPGLNLLIYLK